jgi:hypothetical protein
MYDTFKKKYIYSEKLMDRLDIRNYDGILFFLLYFYVINDNNNNKEMKNIEFSSSPRNEINV